MPHAMATNVLLTRKVNVDIKSRTQKAYPPQSVRKLIESIEYDRLQQTRQKPTRLETMMPFDVDDPIAYEYSFL
jgi:hypothetical protein